MKIGVISDTHGFLDPSVARILAGVDHILHAGDVGPHSLLLELGAIAPVTAVLGNTDTWLPLQLIESVELAGRKFLVHHIVNPHALTDDLKERVARERPDAVVFGHTHKQFARMINGILFLNPGYASRARFHQPRSLALLHAVEQELRAEFIAL